MGRQSVFGENRDQHPRLYFVAQGIPIKENCDCEMMYNASHPNGQKKHVPNCSYKGYNHGGATRESTFQLMLTRDEVREHILTWLGEAGYLDGDLQYGFNANRFSSSAGNRSAEPEDCITSHYGAKRTGKTGKNGCSIQPETRSLSYFVVEWYLYSQRRANNLGTFNGDMSLFMEEYFPEVFRHRDFPMYQIVGMRTGTWQTYKRRYFHSMLKLFWDNLTERVGGKPTAHDVYLGVHTLSHKGVNSLLPRFVWDKLYNVMAGKAKETRPPAPNDLCNIAVKKYSRKRSGPQRTGDYVRYLLAREVVKRFVDRQQGRFTNSTFDILDYIFAMDDLGRCTIRYEWLPAYIGSHPDLYRAGVERLLNGMLPFDYTNFKPQEASLHMIEALYALNAEDTRQHAFFTIMGHICDTKSLSKRMSVNAWHLGHYMNHKVGWLNPQATRQTWPLNMERWSPTATSEVLFNALLVETLGEVGSADGIYGRSLDQNLVTMRVYAPELMNMRYPELEGYVGLDAKGANIMRPDGAIFNASWFGYTLIIEVNGGSHFKEHRRGELEPRLMKDCWKVIHWGGYSHFRQAIIPTASANTMFQVVREIEGVTVDLYSQLTYDGDRIMRWNNHLLTANRPRMTTGFGLVEMLEAQGDYLYATLLEVKGMFPSLTNDEASVMSLLVNESGLSIDESLETMRSMDMEEWKDIWNYQAPMEESE